MTPHSSSILNESELHSASFKKHFPLVHRELKVWSPASVEEQPSCCGLCQDVLRDPFSTSCGHWFCSQCISSYWDQSASSEDVSCPKCRKRSRTRPGLQAASQTSTVQSKIEHLYADVTRFSVLQRSRIARHENVKLCCI